MNGGCSAIVEYMMHDPEIVGLNIARVFSQGLSTAHVRADLLDWSSSAKWALPGPAMMLSAFFFSFNYVAIVV